ncbi:hypothetical protein AB3X52_16425 [Nocardioides sp. DS6]|uniref:DUF4149 domain-containing protein n=1 Tax=Nocardioides eburneus TaxID=3231482 RepID=A0ABV3T343_9ACTN
MSDAATALGAAVAWLWLGMVLAISFLEAPLKFRAPGLELRVGLAIGRLVFRALNTVEAVLAVVTVLALVLGTPGPVAVVGGVVSVVVLGVQLAVVRPRLARRSDRVLAGDDGPRSHAHFWYVGFEIVKVAALVVLGVTLLAR